ncbi:MAG: flagellin [Micropepsaceae bacterium]
MERVATLMHSSAMLAELSRAQRNMFDAQTQVSTGKRINEFADAPQDLGALLAARNADARTADFLASAKAIRTRLDLQDTHIDELASITADMKQSVLDAVANSSGAGLKAELEGVFSRMVSILNTQIDGKYIYGGTRQDVPPVTVGSLGELMALPSVADAFQNNNVAATGRIDNNQVIAFGQMADQLGGPAFDMLRQVMAYDAGPSGPFGNDMSQTQSQFLTGLIPQLTAVNEGVNNLLAANGVAYQAANDAVERHGDARDTLAAMISDIEDVDMAEAVTKLNNAQIALQASAKSYAMVQGLSLLDYLPL